MAAAMEVDAGGEKPSEKELFLAAESGAASVFASLASADLAAALSLRNEDGRSLVHAVTALVAAGGDAVASAVNGKDEEGWAPIHSVASSGNAEIVDILLDHGANVDLTTDAGRTALHYAASKGRLLIAQTLIAHRANVNKKDKFGCTPLHRAASTGNAELCEYLLEEGADIDAVDKLGQSPIMHAVICEDRGVALLLIRHGADVDIEDKEGYTVLGRASDSFRPALIDAAKAMLEDGLRTTIVVQDKTENPVLIAI
ncbi:26S proteasome non-ATPase regulatory subunit 10 [Hordeum vulgare]|nr:26S proteasome non-ATPase regulatory subunit 10 [Hordeum vulgare]